jgi:hypothetical protein
VVQNFYSGAVADTDQALSRLKTAGTPNVKNGKTISASTVRAFTQLKHVFNQAASDAWSLPTDDPKAFGTAAQAIGQTVSSSANGVRASLSQLDNSAALKQAEAKEPACKGLST